jgi:hypothetical protein
MPMTKRPGRPPVAAAKRKRKYHTYIANGGADVKFLEAECKLSNDSELIRKCVEYAATLIRSGMIKPKALILGLVDDLLDK